MFLFLFIAEPPDGQQFSFLSLSFFSFLPVVLIVVVFLVLFVLADHTLHDLHAALEGGGVPASSCFFVLLLLGLAGFVVVFIFFFELLDVGVPDGPLGDLSSEVVGDGRAGGSSSFLDGRVDGLYFSIFVVEFVLHGLLDSFYIFS